MNNNSIFLLDPGFNAGMAADCNLLLTVNDNSFSYAIVGVEDGGIKALFDIQAVENILSTLERCFKNDPFLSLPYQQINAAVATENEVLVPDVIYEQIETKNLVNFFSVDSGNLYTNKTLPGFKAVFDIKTEVDAFFEASAARYHPVAPLLMLAEADGLYLNFTASSAYFLVKKDGEIIFQNQFQIDNADELNYYLLLVINTLKVDLASTPVWLTGIINKGDSKCSAIEQHFRTIDFIRPKGVQLDGSIIENLPQHYFSALLALHLCA